MPWPNIVSLSTKTSNARFQGALNHGLLSHLHLVRLFRSSREPAQAGPWNIKYTSCPDHPFSDIDFTRNPQTTGSYTDAMSYSFGEPYVMSSEQKAAAKNKRLLSASDEDIEDTMDAKQLPYRAGWPDLQPLPLVTVNHYLANCLTPAQQVDILNKARTVLQAQRLAFDGLHLAYRVPEDIPADGTVNLSPYLTLLFTADFINDAHKLTLCIVRLRQSFLTNDAYKGISIECLHFTCLNRPRTYAILPNDGAVRSITSDVMDHITEQLKLKKMSWLCMEVTRRGLTDTYGQCPPTVLITSPEAADARWYNEILPELRASLNDHAPAFKIEVLYASSIFGARRKYTPTKKVNHTAYGNTVWMGSSIGVETELECGATLGGLVTLVGGGQSERRCAITNWHVVRDDRLDKGNLISSAASSHMVIDNPIALSTSTKALDPYHSTLQNKPQYMNSPSTEDHRGYLGTMQRQLKNYQENNMKDMWKAKNQQYLSIDKVNRRIGHVHAGSGFRHVKTPRYATDPASGGKSKDTSKAQFNFTLDWALVTVTNPTNRQVANILPDVEPPHKPITAMTASFVCRKWSVFDVNKDSVPVTKVGRTSGWTFGNIGSELCRINPEVHNKEFAEMAEHYGFTTDNPGFCFHVVNEYESFLEPGDSGSILLHNPSGAWLGLCFGRTGAGHGMFTPIDRVFQDIKTITAQQVSEPMFVSKSDMHSLA